MSTKTTTRALLAKCLEHIVLPVHSRWEKRTASRCREVVVVLRVSNGVMKLDRTVTDLLCAASVKHLHQTIEELPVGIIEVDDDGNMFSLNDFSEQILGVTKNEVKGKHLATIFGDIAECWSEQIKSRIAGYLGAAEVKTQAGVSLNANIAMTPCVRHTLEPNRKCVQIILSLDL